MESILEDYEYTSMSAVIIDGKVFDPGFEKYTYLCNDMPYLRDTITVDQRGITRKFHSSDGDTTWDYKFDFTVENGKFELEGYSSSRDQIYIKISEGIATIINDGDSSQVEVKRSATNLIDKIVNMKIHPDDIVSEISEFMKLD